MKKYIIIKDTADYKKGHIIETDDKFQQEYFEANPFYYKEELTPEQLKELHEGGIQAELAEYNKALKKLDKALDDLNENIKDRLAEAKEAYNDLYWKINGKSLPF